MPWRVPPLPVALELWRGRPAQGSNADLFGTTSSCGNRVYDVGGRFLGEIEEPVLEIRSGRIADILVAVAGFLGMGRRLLVVPWSAVTVDCPYQRCVTKFDLERLLDAPCPDGDLLPRIADPGWATEVHAWFGCKPYWK